MSSPDSPHFAIAIDGPAASGKSTIARLLAQRLGLVMVNSGAMYRAVTWKVLSEHIDPQDSVSVASLLQRIHITCGHDGISSTITIDGIDPGDALRSESVNKNVSAISAIPEVRQALIDLQRGYIQHSNIVMEGRDIGSVVFPDTPFKVYIDASEEIRAARRKAAGEVDSIASRDAADSSRLTAPLIVAPGATRLDTSDLSIDGAVDATLEILKQQGLQA